MAVTPHPTFRNIRRACITLEGHGFDITGHTLADRVKELTELAMLDSDVILVMMSDVCKGCHQLGAHVMGIVGKATWQFTVPPKPRRCTFLKHCGQHF